MSQSPNGSSDDSASCQSGSCQSLPAWLSFGVLGLVVGVGGTLLYLQGLHPDGSAAKSAANAGAPATAPMSPPGMGGGGMGGGGMGGGGMGGGGGGGAKRALTSLVGKLELLSRPELKLQVLLDGEQSKAVVGKLMELDKTETMSSDEAQANVDAIEALLTPEQKEALSAIGLPGGRGGGRGGPGGAPGGGGPPGGGPPGGAMGGGGMGRGGGDPNENPFTQEANQKRLHDLLGRLTTSSTPSNDKSQ